MECDKSRTQEPDKTDEILNDNEASDDDMLEAIATGKLSGCQAFRTLASAVKKGSDEAK